MRLTINADWEQLRKLIPIIDMMLDKNFISMDNSFIAPFQYGGSKKDSAIIRCTKSGNFIIDMMEVS